LALLDRRAASNPARAQRFNYIKAFCDMSDEKTQKQFILELLGDLQILYADLYRLIMEYEPRLWEGKQVQEIKMDSDPWRMTTDKKYLYLCMRNFKCVSRYTVDTLQLVDEFPMISPSAIDISGNELYVHEEDVSIKVFNIVTKEIIREWNTLGYARAIKVNGENLYYADCSQENDYQIHVYNLSGSLIREFGKLGSEPGEFMCPYGMDIDDQFIYIGDNANSRVQVFHLLSFSSSHQWGSSGKENGKFTNLHEIRLYQDLCYVGDDIGIQMFTKEGDFLCRLGKDKAGSGPCEFDCIRGIVVMDTRLYVSDYANTRVVVYNNC